MKPLLLIPWLATALLLTLSRPGLAQYRPEPPARNDSPGAPGASAQGGGRRGFGGRGFRFGPMLSAEDRAEVDRINAALEPETTAINTASSNLVLVTFTTPVDKDKIAQANDELAKARQAWVEKASRLFAETQASDKKLSSNAVAFLVQSAGGRGRGGFGRFGFGRGGQPGFPNQPPDGARGQSRGRSGQPGGPPQDQ